MVKPATNIVKPASDGKTCSEWENLPMMLKPATNIVKPANDGKTCP